MEGAELHKCKKSGGIAVKDRFCNFVTVLIFNVTVSQNLNFVLQFSLGNNVFTENYFVFK